ncbi:MAG: CoA transferase [Solirubrobacterales bacterium]
MDGPMPLEGVRILDATTWQTGSGGTVMLADMGADVIKIESPGAGDPGRHWRLPGEPADGMSSFFEVMNRNKRSLTVDLKADAGRELFYRLVETADVVALNVRPSVPARLGIDYETLAEKNPRIIVAMTTGLGVRGPEADRPLYDLVGHARSGMLRLLSDPDLPVPRYVGSWGVADEAGAIMLAMSILAALAARAVHGVGQLVDTSQLAAMVTLQAYPLQVYMYTGESPWEEMRWKQRSNPLFAVYQGSDGVPFCIAGHPRDRYWPRLCEELGLGTLADEPRYLVPGELAIEVAEEIRELLTPAFAGRPAAHWIERLTALDIPVSPVADYADVVADPQVLANDLVVEVDHPLSGPVREPWLPLNFSRTPARFRHSAPGLGEHTDEVLAELGLAPEEVADLRVEGVV